jgi:hypothetical protein
VRIEPIGYEDESTHEWKGSFWVIAAVVDTKESILLFNETVSKISGLNKIGDKTIVPTSSIKITITPRQPYWEIPLVNRDYVVYPTTYGTHLRLLFNGIPYKIPEKYVPSLIATVLEPSIPYRCYLYTPFEIKVEKIGKKSFHANSLN